MEIRKAGNMGHVERREHELIVQGTYAMSYSSGALSAFQRGVVRDIMESYHKALVRGSSCGGAFTSSVGIPGHGPDGVRELSDLMGLMFSYRRVRDRRGVTENVCGPFFTRIGGQPGASTMEFTVNPEMAVLVEYFAEGFKTGDLLDPMESEMRHPNAVTMAGIVGSIPEGEGMTLTTARMRDLFSLGDRYLLSSLRRNVLEPMRRLFHGGSLEFSYRTDRKTGDAGSVTLIRKGK